jgi:hypothetical protein
MLPQEQGPSVHQEAHADVRCANKGTKLKQMHLLLLRDMARWQASAPTPLQACLTTDVAAAVEAAT